MLVTEVYTFSLSKTWKNSKMQVMNPSMTGLCDEYRGGRLGSVGKVGDRTPNIMRSLMHFSVCLGSLESNISISMKSYCSTAEGS